VEDEFQRVGLGTELLRRLAEAARRKGVRVLEGSSLPDNIPMLRLAQRQGARRTYQDPGEVVLAWPLERSAEPRCEPERTAG
jgi:GNAT superfamily N-acetyltransferase